MLLLHPFQSLLQTTISTNGIPSTLLSTLTNETEDNVVYSTSLITGLY